MKKVEDILEKVFPDYLRGFNIRLWNGQMIKWSDSPAFTLIFKNKAGFKKLFLRKDFFSAGSVYIEGHLDIEGDIFKAMEVGECLGRRKLGLKDKLKILAGVLTL